jgi:hypothetical protein
LTKQALSAGQSSSKSSNIIISHPKGFHNVFIQYNSNRLLVGSLLPTAEELSKMAQELELQMVHHPDPSAKHYLAVLQPS